MATTRQQAQNPLLLRFHRLMDAFAKSDDERDFYLDKIEGFIIYVDLDKGQKELDELEQELVTNSDRYCLVPKMTFYEIKKFMEGFVNEKVYDIDTKEKLLDVIQSREARENFLEFIYDHLTELEKWQQYYQERSRIRIIEWLRQQQIQFVFEEDLDINKAMLEKIKRHLFEAKVPKDVASAREILTSKAKTYYSSDALNPRPKRGRPPKQVVKVEQEPQVSSDMYTTVPSAAFQFLYLPEITSAKEVTFSNRYGSESELLASLKGSSRAKINTKLRDLSERLASLRQISTRLSDIHETTGLDKEDRLIRAMSQQQDDSGEVEEEGKRKGILDVVKGFLPRKKESAAKTEEEVAAEKAKAVKMVTPISYKKKR